MAVSLARTIATTATVLVPAANLDPDMNYLIVAAPSGNTADVFIGGATVTTANGVPLSAGTSMVFDLNQGELLYGIVAAATQGVRVLITGTVN